MKNYMFGDKKIKIKDSERSLISETVSIEGTINSSGAIDIAGLVKGPVYSKELIIRDTGSITGHIEADDVENTNISDLSLSEVYTLDKWYSSSKGNIIVLVL